MSTTHDPRGETDKNRGRHDVIDVSARKVAIDDINKIVADESCSKTEKSSAASLIILEMMFIPSGLSQLSVDSQ